MKVACDHWKYWKFQIHWEKLEYVVPLKLDTKKTPFCMSSNKLFLKDGLHDNNRVGKPVMKPVDYVTFQKRKALMEGKNDESNKFGMKILDEGVLDKALEGPEKFRQGITPEDNL